ncbi:MAG: cytochrome d ubiquinol oxidase subunit II [Saprospiraceae bacterium]|nr:cytochrome d ubiquinol oxidase subunit II [Saprospiraceae bacterium]
METYFGLDLNTWWFLVLGAVLTGYAVLDGFDLGVGIIHLYFRKEESRRIALNAIGPVWDGNEVWLVIAGGAMFAGYPIVYATVFSAFYVPFMLLLTGLIFRAVAIEFRSKEPMVWWRWTWDIMFSASSILITILLGLVMGNLIQGLAIDKDFEFTGSWLSFLNPYAFLIALTTLALFTMHGAMFLLLKTEDRMYARLTVLAKNLVITFVIIFAIATVATLIYIPQMAEKFRNQPLLFIVPMVAILAVANIPRLITKRQYMLAFIFSGITSGLLLILFSIGLFPNIVLSTISPEFNLNIYNAASSQKTMKNLMTVALIGVPLVAIYTISVFWIFKGKVQKDKMIY